MVAARELLSGVMMVKSSSSSQLYSAMIWVLTGSLTLLGAEPPNALLKKSSLTALAQPDMSFAGSFDASFVLCEARQHWGAVARALDDGAERTAFSAEGVAALL